MRPPSDLPRQRRSGSIGDRGRIVLISIAVVVFALLLSARFLSRFYIDYLWHKSIGRGDVFWGVLGSQVTLFALFGLVFIAVAVVNLVIADRLAPLAFSANMHPVVERFHEVFGRKLRLVRIGVAIVFGLLFALPATAQWRQWLLFRNSQSFGIDDAQFGNDIGFYVFRLPFITFALDWFYAALIFVTLLVLQILLGAMVIWTLRRPEMTTAHVVIGALTLAVTFWLTWFAHRDRLDGPAPLATPSRG